MPVGSGLLFTGNCFLVDCTCASRGAAVNMVWQALGWLLRAIWRNYRVLWTCRISVLSSIGGGLFIAATPQTRDLFADFCLSSKLALFFLFAFGWAWSVDLGAPPSLRL